MTRRARWARRLLCPVGWHDWQFVLASERGQVWALTRCRRCVAPADVGVPMNRDRRDHRDSAC